jgi:transcriptional regulator with XRE-family HTH domain
MPKPSGKMTPAEREICARLKFFRETIAWSQKRFAMLLGLTYNQLASIEYERTPLRYGIAWKVREFFGLSLSWMAEGKYPPNEPDLDPWPNPETLKTRRFLLSEVTETLRFSDPKNPAVKEREKVWFEKHRKETSLGPSRSVLLAVVKHSLAQWLARVPDANLRDFAGQIYEFADNYVSRFSKESGIKVGVRTRALIWGEMREEINKRLSRKAAEFQHLTETSTCRNVPTVKSEWTVLKRRLQDATAKPGTKTMLADFLGVDLTRVSQWLTDSKNAREPGGEYTLKLLRWVEQQERQK